MAASKTSPVIRFPEFKEPWAEERLDFFFISSRAKGRDGLPTLSVTLDRGLIDRAVLDRKMETNLGPDEHLLVRVKDIAYNMMRMWQGAFGRSDREGIVSPAYVVIRPKGTANSAYFAYAFRRNRSIYLFWAYSYGITNDRLRLYADDFLRIPFRAPKVPEQQKIAAFLTAVDGRIEQLSRKKALLEEYKKGVMQQLFTQTLRFQDDHGHDFPDWEEKPLGSVATLVNGRAYKQNELLSEGPYPVLRVGNFFSNPEWYYSDLELPKDKYCDTGDLLYAWSASFGPRIWKGGKVIYHYHIWKVLPSTLVDKNYLFHFMDWDTERIKRAQSSGAVMLHVTKQSMEERPMPVPSLPEQTKIAGFLSALDGKIGAVGEQMRQTQAWK